VISSTPTGAAVGAASVGTAVAVGVAGAVVSVGTTGVFVGGAGVSVVAAGPQALTRAIRMISVAVLIKGLAMGFVLVLFEM
jgi:hypothetical protein